MQALRVDGLSKSIGDRVLFSNISFILQQGDKVGLIAPNGTGKSTLLSIIAGKGQKDSGIVEMTDPLRLGYLDQSPEYDPNKSIRQYMEELPHQEEDWNFHDRMVSLLTSLDIKDIDKLMGLLSGGQVKRVATARVLLDNPDILLLDEPTNHLDIEMVEWLENYLSRAKTTLLMVTHDRYFLDRVCNQIIEIEDGKIYGYNGGYDYYLEKRQERHNAQNAELARVKNLLRTELEWMRRQPQARGSKAKYRIDNFYQLKERSKTINPKGDLKIGATKTYIGSKIFEAHSVSKAFGDKIILKEWEYTFARFDKVGVIGNNGVGKSTLIKLLQGIISPDSGHFAIGETVKFGYYSQEGIEFDTQKKVIDAAREIAEVVRIDDKTTLTAQQFLCRFLFPVSDQQKYIYKLSGGERRRLYLAIVLMQNPNFLILDEPTNDLDIPTLAILEDYLAAFKGCVLVVSHDRYFLDRVANHLFVLTGNGEVQDFPGDYSTYRHCLETQKREERKEEKSKNSPIINTKPKSRKITFKEKKEMEELETIIPRLENEKEEIVKMMSSGEMTPEAIFDAGEKIRKLTEDIDEKEFRLLQLMEINDQ